MAIVLNATPGDPSANAYSTLAEADAYHEGRGHNEAWINSTAEEKSQAIVWATRLLDQEQLKGSKTFPGGALRCPRAGLVDRDGFSIPSGVIPRFLKEAIAEWAYQLRVEDRTSDAGGLVEYGGKVGPLADAARIERNPIPAIVKEMLEPLFRSGASTMIRLGRS